jgi:AcrR family transcriptional regulator
MLTPEITRPGRDDRRSAILQIAREAFLQNGYAATSMSQIAAKLGGSKATLYNYFPSKKDLFVAVADVESAKVLSQLYIVNETDGDIRAALVNHCHRFLTLVLSEDMIAFYRMIVAESVRFPEVGQTAYELGFKRGIDRIEAFLMQAMESGQLRKADARIAAECLLDLGAGYLHKLRLWGVIGNVSEKVINTHVEAIVAIFLSAFGNDEISQAARANL